MARRLSSWGIASPDEYAWPAVTPDDASAIVPALQTWLRSFNARQSRRGRLLSKYEAACFASHWLLLTALGKAVKAGELAIDDWVLVLEDDVVCTDPAVPPHKVFDVMGEVTRALPYDTDVFWWGTLDSKDIPQGDPTYKQRFQEAMKDAPTPVRVAAWCGATAIMYHGIFLLSLAEQGLQLFQGLLPIDHAIFASVAGRGGRGASSVRCTGQGKCRARGLLNHEPGMPSTLNHPNKF
jgi:Glycosyltransferase involved in LPS biosynthesis